MAKSFELGREIAKDGRFERQASVFRRWVTSDGSSEFPAEAGRYHLYVCLACPWSHRAVLGRRLKGLEEAISISYADPYRDERGWAFSGGEFRDQINDFSFLKEAYAARHGAGALGQAHRPDREQRVERHPAHVERCLRDVGH
jgi:glutathionyl-hydroquinone reductase